MRTTWGGRWSSAAAVLGAGAASTSCGQPGGAAGALRPNDPTAAGAMGEPAGECHEVEAYGEPLVVDWKSDERGNLEVAMSEGVAVVAYSCKGIKLLKDCHIEGKYGFIGMTKREHMIKLENSDEVRANLPAFGGPMAAKLGGEMARGATLDIALVTVGKRRTTWTTPTKEDLKGSCEGATHFVRGATVGAFVLETGTKAQARVVAEMFGVGADAKSGSSKSVRNQDGDISDCSKSSPDADKSPPQCGAALRLEMTAFAPSKGGDKTAEAPPAKAPPKDDVQVSVPEEPCPKGLVFTAGKCAEAASAPAYQCEPGNLEQCAAQCGKKHAGSCGALGAMYADGHGVGRDFAKAAEFFKQGCDGGDTRACVNRGALEVGGQGVARDPAAAARLFEKGCNDGDSNGCGRLGRLYLEGLGVSKDEAKAAVLLGKACEGGDHQGCGKLGLLYRDGRGVAQSLDRAGEFFKRACDGHDGPSCNDLGEMHERGKGARHDPIAAGIFYQRACYGGTFEACVNLGRMEQSGTFGSESQAKLHFETACNFGVSLGCAVLKVAYRESNRSAFPDMTRQMAAEQSCHQGNARDCGIAGVMSAAQGMPSGKSNLENGCNQGDKWSCVVLKALR